MGWENRKHRPYYYRKSREGGRVVSTYVRSGPLSEFIALQDEGARLIEEWKRVGVWLFQSDYEAAEAAYDALSELVDERVDLVLTALGYRKRHGEWRRCRAARPSLSVEPVTIEPTTPEPTTPSVPMSNTTTPSQERAAIRAALTKNSTTMESALQEARHLKMNIETALAQGKHEEYNYYLTRLREALRERPALWGRADEHVRQTADAFLFAFTKNDDALRPVVLNALADLLDELGYGTCPPLERLLVERVALAWLACRATDWCYRALAFRTEPGAEGRESKEPEHGPYWERRAAAADRRLERAVESLARTRKLVRATKGVQREYASLSAPAASEPVSGTVNDGSEDAAVEDRAVGEPGRDESATADRITVDMVQGVLDAMAAEEATAEAAAGRRTEKEEAPDDEDDVCYLDVMDEWSAAGKDLRVLQRATWAGLEPWREGFDTTPFEDGNFDPCAYSDEPYLGQ